MTTDSEKKLRELVQAVLRKHGIAPQDHEMHTNAAVKYIFESDAITAIERRKQIDKPQVQEKISGIVEDYLLREKINVHPEARIPERLKKPPTQERRGVNVREEVPFMPKTRLSRVWKN